MRLSKFRTALLAVFTAATALLSSGCGQLMGEGSYLPDVAAVQATDLGSALKNYGYTPVLQSGDQIIFTACDTSTTTLSQCSDQRDSLATAEKPNVYINVRSGILFKLEGPYVKDGDKRNYFVNVPEDYQDFAALSTEQQQTLLNMMPQVVDLIGRPSNNGHQTIMLAIGQTTAYVSY